MMLEDRENFLSIWEQIDLKLDIHKRRSLKKNQDREKVQT